MFGKMRDAPDPQPTADDTQPNIPIPYLPTDITFPNLPTGHGINLETRKTVARLHLNLGHPSPQELTRMVAYYGGAPSSTTTCIQHLRCATCDRLKNVQQPRPATMPKFTAGQFGDEVQGDLFYVRLLSTEAIPILGLVDKATGFHQAVVCQTRNSAETFSIFRQCWLQPFGLPYKVMLDPDPTFRGDFQSQVEHLGIICDFCPAEAHWIIGMIERRNAVLRCVLEKLIDQFAVYEVNVLENILPAALHAVNSSTFTRGRTAYQAVFGRIPRLPGGIFNDDTAITSSPMVIDGSDNLLAKAEIIRSEAQKHLIDLNCSQQLRRALLRKTKMTKFPDLQPGQNCAYWRWQRKGQKKRGAWVIARFLSWDPSAPMKLAWLQTGASTTLVSVEQLRTATGFEGWNPSAEDVKALKSGIKSFQDHLLEDETGPAAPEPTFDETFTIDTTEQPVSLTAPPPPESLQPQQQPQAAATPLQLPPPNISTAQEQSIQLNLQQSPTYRQTNIYQRFGAPPTPRQLTPTQHRQPSTPPPRPLRGRSRSPAPTTTQRLMDYIEDPAQPVSQPEAGSQPLEQQDGEEKPPGSQPSLQRHLHQPPLTPQELRQPVTPLEQDYHQPGNVTPPLQPTSTSQPSSLHQEQTPLHLPPSQQQQQQTEVIDLTGQESQPVSLPGNLPTEVPGNLPASTTTDPYMSVDEQALLTTEASLRINDHLSTWFGRLDIHACPHGQMRHQTLAMDQRSKHTSEHMQQHNNALKTCNTHTSRKQSQTQQQHLTRKLEATTSHTATGNGSLTGKKASRPTNKTQTSNNQRLTRQEAKQLDRELPWREIWAMPKAHIQKFLAAIEKEANSWSEWQSIRPLSDEEIAKIKADPALRKRVLRSRAAYRDKNRSQGELKAKCRIVALGHNDPDLSEFTNTWTNHRTSGLCICRRRHEWRAGQNHHEVESMARRCSHRLPSRKTTRWRKKDASLHGTTQRPPDRPHSLCWKTDIYEVTGDIYGLPNAPHLWCQEVIGRLKKIGYIQHDFDKMLFCLYDDNNQIQSLVMCYVDDFFGIHRDDHQIKELHEQFKWGELRYFEPEQPQTFKGKELCFTKNNLGRFTLRVTMKKFLETVEPYVLPKGRMQKPPTRSQDEHREFRSIAGCLQWLGSQARPDLCPAISLSNHGQSTTIHDLKTLAETLQFAKDTHEYGFVMEDLPVNEQSVILTYTDASWGNAAHSISQMGILVTLTTPDVTEKTCKVMILDWRSARSPRACRSTLAAEASAADEGSDRAAFINMMISEVLHCEKAHKIGCKLDNLQATDSKSLYVV